MSSFALLVLTVAAALRLRRHLLDRRSRARAELMLEAALVEAVDVLRLALSAGLSVHGAVALLADHAPDPMAPALAEVTRRVALGERLGAALDALEVWGEPGRPVVSVLRSAAFDGAALATSLDRVADEVRDVRRRRAEARARRLPIQLLFPLTVCVLPAFVLLAVVPLLVSTWPVDR